MAEAIAGEVLARDFDKLAEVEKVYAKRGVLKEEQKETKEATGRGRKGLCQERGTKRGTERDKRGRQMPGMLDNL